MIRAVPSWSVTLPDIVVPGSRLQIGRDTLMHPRWVAEVESVAPSEVHLRSDADDLADAALAPGDNVVLALGAADRGMLYVCDVTVLRSERGHLVVTYPSAPRKAPRRAATRIAQVWRCAIALEGWLPIMTTTVNVSASGALLACPPELARADLRPGDKLSLTLEVAHRAGIRLRGRVVRIDRPAGGDGRARTIAVSYEAMSEIEETRLQLAVLRAMARHYVRIKVERPCQLELAPPDGAPRRLEGRTENISGSGMLIRVPGAPELAVGWSGTARTSLDGPLEIAPVTVQRRDVGPDGDTLLAISYADSPRDVRSQIVEFVMEALRRV